MFRLYFAQDTHQTYDVAGMLHGARARIKYVLRTFLSAGSAAPLLYLSNTSVRMSRAPNFLPLNWTLETRRLTPECCKHEICRWAGARIRYKGKFKGPNGVEV